MTIDQVGVRKVGTSMMTDRLGWWVSTGLLFACMLMLTAVIPSATCAMHDLIVHVEDVDGNTISDAQVVVITPEGDRLKTVWLTDSTYACYGLHGKVTLEIEQKDHGRTHFDVALYQGTVPEAEFSVVAEVCVNVVLGQSAIERRPDWVKPPNDLCENAIPLPVPSVTPGTTADATFDDVGSCGTSNTASGVWFSVVGGGTTITAATRGDSFDHDAKITVFCGACGDLICIDSNDVNCFGGASGQSSTASWCAQEGVEYFILVHGLSDEIGDFELLLSEDGQPCTAEVACIPTGACSLPDASCDDGLTEAECAAQAGLYRGDGTQCTGFLVPDSFEDCATAFEYISGSGISIKPFYDSGRKIELSLTEDAQVSVVVYDVAGREVKTLANGYIDSGHHTFEWNGTDEAGRSVVGGVYFCRVKTEGLSRTVKMIKAD